MESEKETMSLNKYEQAQKRVASNRKIIIFGSIPVGIFLNAIAMVFLWKWFVAPLGIMQITMAHSLGLRMLIAFITNPPMAPTVKQKEDWNADAWRNVTIGPAMLFVGWILTLFM